MTLFSWRNETFSRVIDVDMKRCRTCKSVSYFDVFGRLLRSELLFSTEYFWIFTVQYNEASILLWCVLIMVRERISIWFVDCVDLSNLLYSAEYDSWILEFESYKINSSAPKLMLPLIQMQRPHGVCTFWTTSLPPSPPCWCKHGSRPSLCKSTHGKILSRLPCS